MFMMGVANVQKGCFVGEKIWCVVCKQIRPRPETFMRCNTSGVGHFVSLVHGGGRQGRAASQFLHIRRIDWI